LGGVDLGGGGKEDEDEAVCEKGDFADRSEAGNAGEPGGKVGSGVWRQA
jgi:hypothetical protein